MKAFITGGAGFIGSHIVDFLSDSGWEITVVDNLSGGKKEYLKKHFDKAYFTFFQGDVLDKFFLNKVLPLDTDIVFHFSANANVKKGIKDTNLDIQQTILATHNILEAMREKNIKKIVFPSSMTVYGKSSGLPFREDFGPCLPISLYASAKLGAEALISAYVNSFGIKAWIFRFANVIGERLTHGVIYDLIKKLKVNPKMLKVLGDGSQTKPYIHISDIIQAMFFVLNKAENNINLFNLGVTDKISVREIAEKICEQMKLSPKIIYEKHKEGWIGDVTECDLDISKLMRLGFSPLYSSVQAVDATISELLDE